MDISKSVPDLSDIRTLCSKYLNQKHGQSFEIIDDDISNTKTTIELSHFIFESNPSITVTLTNFPILFLDESINYIWAFFSTAFIDTDLSEADFRITKVTGKKRPDDEILNRLKVLWNNE